jgi:hypothetical protein
MTLMLAPKVTQHMIKVLCPDGVVDGGAPWVLLLGWKLIKYNYATLFCQFDDFSHGKRAFVVEDVS